MGASVDQRRDILWRNSADRYDRNLHCLRHVGDELYARWRSSGVTRRLEHRSSNAPRRAFTLRLDCLADAVNACTHRKVRRCSKRFGYAKRMRRELDSACTDSECDVDSVVHDQPASGGRLSRGEENRKLMEFTSRYPR